MTNLMLLVYVDSVPPVSGWLVRIKGSWILQWLKWPDASSSLGGGININLQIH